MFWSTLTLVVPVLFGTIDGFAFSTAGDTEAIQSAAPVRWRDGRFFFVLNSQVENTLSIEAYELTVRAALATWAAPSCTSLLIVYGGQTDLLAKPGDGMNTIQWVSGAWASRGFDPAAPAFADVNYEQQPDGSWAITEADIYINGEYGAWTLKADQATSQIGLWNVLVHESGHAIGLEHPCENTEASGVPLCNSNSGFNEVVMNPEYSATRVSLSADDMAGVCWLYSAGGSCGNASCASMSVCSDDGCHDPCGPLLCGLNQVCADGTCVDGAASQSDAGVPGQILVDVGQSCLDTTTCRRGLSCVNGICSGGALLAGDLCHKDAECESGVCLSQGYCAAACLDASQCPEPDSECSEIAQYYGGCLSGLGPMGQACSTSVDCIGNQCLSENGSAPVCTRLCNGANQICPTGWYCNEYEGRAVCSTSGPRATGCACRLAAQRSNQRGLIFVSAIAAILAAVKRRRRCDMSFDNK